jgi:hypothetical protein
MAAEALELQVEGMFADHETIPAPSALDTIMSDPDNRDAVAFLVDVATRPAKSVRINVMLPEDLIAALDRIAKNRSRSGLRPRGNWFADELSSSAPVLLHEWRHFRLA